MSRRGKGFVWTVSYALSVTIIILAIIAIVLLLMYVIRLLLVALL